MYFFADRSFVENVCKSDIECAIFVTSELRRWDFRLVPTERKDTRAVLELYKYCR